MSQFLKINCKRGKYVPSIRYIFQNTIYTSLDLKIDRKFKIGKHLGKITSVFPGIERCPEGGRQSLRDFQQNNEAGRSGAASGGSGAAGGEGVQAWRRGAAVN